MLSHPDLVSLHQDVIMSCIDDADVSIRLQAIDLSAGMVNKENLLDFVGRLLQQLRYTPFTSTTAEDGRIPAMDIEPAGDSEGEDPEQVLQQSEDRHFDGDPNLSPEYRLAMIKQILNTCTKDTYANISDFTWYINVLVQLVELVPAEPGSNFKNQETNDQRNLVPQITGEEILADIGRELRNIAVRVLSVRSEAVNAAVKLLRCTGEHPATALACSFGGGALPYAAWVIGEYADQLTDLDTTLITFTHPRVGSLPSTILCAYLQAIPKLFASIVLRGARTWTGERQTTTSLLIARLLYFLEPLTTSPSLEVQERAVELAELLRLASQAVANHARDSDHWPLLLTKAIPQLFGGSDLNPITPSAQRRVPNPHDLDLDVPLNPDLAILLRQADEMLLHNQGAIDFEIFYCQKPDRRTRDVERAVEKPATVEDGLLSYQNTDHPDSESKLVMQKRLERQVKNKDDPFYIAGDFSGASTPFHDIIASSNDESLDLDSIPIMNLDLGDKTSNDSYSDPVQSRPTIKHPKTYQIITDENIDMDNLSESIGTSKWRFETDSGPRGCGARDPSKRSLLEVDSSGLGDVALDGHSSVAAQLEYEKQERDEADMTKALQEVQRLRLEMQRASERVKVSEGISPGGTLVKKKRKKNKKQNTSIDANQLRSTEERAEQVIDDERADAVPSRGTGGDIPIVKRKRRKPAKANESYR